MLSYFFSKLALVVVVFKHFCVILKSNQIMKPADFKNSKQICFLGIGGIGLSAIARMMVLEGKKVSGIDLGASPVTDELKKLGVSIIFTQKIDNIPKDVDLIIYSTALVKRDSDFLDSVKKLRKPMISYPEALGLISEEKFTIAVSGTHGKTTTTAMIAKIMIDAGLDPTVIVGSLLKDTQSNFIHGKSKYLVVEADEYNQSFDFISPKVIVLTNIDNDHLDYYKNLSNIQKAFGRFVSKVPKTGYVITNLSDQKIKPALNKTKCKLIDYSEFIEKKMKLPMPGKHNIENAAAACAVAHILEIPKKKALDSLEKFSGTWRRFDYKGITKKGTVIYDDYAHNPAKVKAALAGYRELYPKKKINVVFQPHLYSRTKLLLEDFSKSFNEADNIIVAPIFAARETPDSSISSEILADRIRSFTESSPNSEKKLVLALADFSEIERYLAESLGDDDVLITMGAGDIYLLAERMVKEQNQK